MVLYKYICVVLCTVFVKYSVAEDQSCSSAFDPNKIKLKLYNRNFHTPIEVNKDNLVPNTEIRVIIHGWTQDSGKPWIQNALKRYIFNDQDSDVIVVDWSAYSNCQYPTTYCLIDKIGNEVGKRLHDLEITDEIFTCSGFSLGAHICGYASRYFKSNGAAKWKLIVGLDAAGVHLECPAKSGKKQKALGKGDANLVIGYYTNGCKTTSFGTKPSAQYADYNVISKDGCCQDECSPCSVPTLKPLPWDDAFQKTVFCNHEYATKIEIDAQTEEEYNVYPCDSVDDCINRVDSGKPPLHLRTLSTSNLKKPMNFYI